MLRAAISTQVWLLKIEAKVNAFPATALNGCRVRDTSTSASSVARKLHKRASIRNCCRSWDFAEPITFRMPISFARVADWAVERLMKLTQARMITKRAMAEKI